MSRFDDSAAGLGGSNGGGRPYGRRADAERNREKVLDHAARMLAEDPAIGMAEIAQAAGVGRATLYRHFPTREDLLAAIDERAMDEAAQAIAGSRLDEGSSVEALRRLIVAFLEIGDRYRFQFAGGGFTDEQRRVRQESLGGPLYALVERGQAAGELTRSLTPTWMIAALSAVIITAVRDVASGRLDREQAAETVAATLLDGYRRA